MIELTTPVLLGDTEAFVLSYGIAGHIGSGLVALAALAFAVYVLVRAARDFGRSRDEEHRFASVRLFLQAVAFVALGAGAIFGVLIASKLALMPLTGNGAWALAYLIVLLFGAAVGAAELVSRYKDRPHRAVATAPAVFYIALNAGAAVGALYLIFVFRESFGFGGTSGDEAWRTDDLVKAVLLAGFSSLLFFRTSLFKLRVGESDLSVGPSIVLDTLLAAADRAVDRVMAEPRADFVHQLMGEVSFAKAAVILPAHCLALMQNVSSEEAQRITGVVNSLRASNDMPDKIKSLNLGLALLTVVGEQVLSTAVTSLRTDLQDTTSWLNQEVASVMAPVSFEHARHLLPTYCYGLWHGTVPEDEQEKLRAEMTEYSVLRTMPDGYKSLILGIRLVRLTDGPTLKRAINDLGDIIRTDPPQRQQSDQPAGAGADKTTSSAGPSRPEQRHGAGGSNKRKATLTPETSVPVPPAGNVNPAPSPTENPAEKRENP